MSVNVLNTSIKHQTFQDFWETWKNWDWSTGLCLSGKQGSKLNRIRHITSLLILQKNLDHELGLIIYIKHWTKVIHYYLREGKSIYFQISAILPISKDIIMPWSPGSGVGFVAISLLWNHPWFYCSWHQVHQQKVRVFVPKPYHFFHRGRFSKWPPPGISEWQWQVAYQIVSEIIRNKKCQQDHICQMFRSRNIGKNRSRVIEL